jgi:Flp pilus assembly protein TadG
MRLIEKIKQFRKESSGASLVEFTLVLPLLLTLSLGIYETTNYILISQKLNEMASGIANWVSAKTTAAQISDCFIGANLIGADYGFSTLGGVVVTGLQKNGTPAQQQVMWQMSSGGASSSITTNSSGYVTASPFVIADQPQMVVVEVSYQYSPTFSYFLTIFPSIKLTRVGQMVARSGGTFSPLPAS